MTQRFFNARSYLAALVLLIAAPASVSAQDAKELARARAASKPAELTVELTIPTTSPHPCDIDKLQVNGNVLAVHCSVMNKHGGDKVTRYAFPVGKAGSQVMMENLIAARTAKKRVEVEFETDTKKNIDGCAKKECRNIVSLTW